eukprot:3317695-Rhodomonas_salina.2
MTVPPYMAALPQDKDTTERKGRKPASIATKQQRHIAHHDSINGNTAPIRAQTACKSGAPDSKKWNGRPTSLHVAEHSRHLCPHCLDCRAHGQCRRQR